MRRLALVIPLVILGCTQDAKPPEGSVVSPVTTAPEHPISTGQHIPLSSGPVSQEPPPDAGLKPGPGMEKMHAQYLLAKSKYATSLSARAAFVAKAIEYANATMKGSEPPRAKYGKALALYEEALRLDKDNVEAKKNRDMILDIYKQMGRTPPNFSR